MKEISVSELKEWQTSGKSFQLIDVREPFEAQVATLDGELIPLGSIEHQTDKITRNIPVVIHCRSGKRSANAIAKLEALGFDNLHNLKGGILAWSDEIDATIPKY